MGVGIIQTQTATGFGLDNMLYADVIQGHHVGAKMAIKLSVMSLIIR
jgi:hypothetical protein